MKLRYFGLAALLATGLLGTPGSAANGQDKMDGQSGSAMKGKTGSVSAADKKFAMNAARGGIAEVKAGKLAASKATSETLKSYGQQMVDEHTAANEKLKAIADGKGVTLPTAPAAKDAAAIAKMSKLSGAAFDSAYKKFAVVSHTDAYKVFSTEVSAGSDSDIKGFAAETLPTVKMHLAHAKQFAGKMAHSKM